MTTSILSLTEANQSVHAVHLEAYEQFLEAATEIDETSMRPRFDTFVEFLINHIEFENNEITPLARNVWPEGRAEIDLVDGDHHILLRTIHAVRRCVDEVVIANRPRRKLVRNLGVLNRMRDVLEHHTLRESNQIYPRLDERLSESEAAMLTRRLFDSKSHLPPR